MRAVYNARVERYPDPCFSNDRHDADQCTMCHCNHSPVRFMHMNHMIMALQGIASCIPGGIGSHGMRGQGTAQFRFRGSSELRGEAMHDSSSEARCEMRGL